MACHVSFREPYTGLANRVHGFLFVRYTKEAEERKEERSHPLQGGDGHPTDFQKGVTMAEVAIWADRFVRGSGPPVKARDKCALKEKTP